MADANSAALDLHDQLSAKLSHLAALLHMTYGEAGDAFRSCSNEIQDNLLWGAAEMAEACRDLLGRMAEQQSAH